MRVGLRIDEVVDGDDFELLAVALFDRLQDLASDAAKAVDPDASRHNVRPFS